MVLEFKDDKDVEVGSLGRLFFKKGKYAYVGSAKAGLWGRVRRHLEGPAKIRWHIDHISIISDRRMVYFKKYRPEDECRSANYLSKRYSSVKGFGCSDCKCGSHLFYLGRSKDNE